MHLATYRSYNCRRAHLAQQPRKYLAIHPTKLLSNRVFKSFDDIVDHCCYAWNTLINQPWKIMSIARATGPSSVTHSEDWYFRRREQTGNLLTA